MRAPSLRAHRIFAVKAGVARSLQDFRIIRATGGSTAETESEDMEERRVVEDRRQQLRRKEDRRLYREALERRKSGSDPDGHERKLRRAIRHNCVADLDYEVVEKRGDSEEWNATRFKINGRVLDLSAEGMAVFTKQPLSMGQVSNLRINVYDGRKIKAKAEVRWTKHKEKKGGYATGLKFVEITEENRKRIEEFLSELDDTLGL